MILFLFCRSKIQLLTVFKSDNASDNLECEIKSKHRKLSLCTLRRLLS